MRVLLGAALAFTAVSTSVLAEETYICTDAKSAGIKWDQRDQQALEKGQLRAGAVIEAQRFRYIMKVASKTERILTPTFGDSKGSSETLTCHATWPSSPDLLACTNFSGFLTWLINGDRYTRSYLYGSVLDPKGITNPDIVVAHGTCLKG